MIRRFSLLSIAIHVLAGMAYAASDLLRIATPPMALQTTFTVPLTIVTLRSPSAVHAATLTATKPGDKPASAADEVTGGSSLSKDSDIAETGREATVNHLLTIVRAAFDAAFIYPPMARRHGWQGNVQLGLTVNADGQLIDLCVLSSSGFSVLDDDALRTVARIGSLSRVAHILDGRSVRLRLPVEYRLIES